MVPRQLAARAALACLLVLVALPAAASGANRRIAISDYRWSDPEIEIDRGEHVTWYWTGPDTMHSVTGDSPNAAGLDSDPNNGNPKHKIGDSFRLDFSQPGTYQFRCKLHSTVKGTITVSPLPGDPESEPDPVPKTNVDLRPPRFTHVKLNRRKFGRKGTPMQYALGERAKLDAEYYRYDPDGRRHFAGYTTWKGTVGFNRATLGERSKHFRPRPGRYLAVLTATDQAQNSSDARRVSFRIRRR